MEPLTKAEFELMEAVWQTPSPITSNRIKENLANGKAWKATTILTLLGKLIDKNYIQAQKQGKFYEYTILISKEEYLRQETQGFLQKLYQGSLKNMLATLYREDSLTETEIAEMKDWFDQEVLK